MKIEFNQAGFDELATSSEIDGLIKGLADGMAASANSVPSTTTPAATEPYYEVQEAGDEHRARYRVRTTGNRASKHEAKTQALQRNI